MRVSVHNAPLEVKDLGFFSPLFEKLKKNHFIVTF